VSRVPPIRELAEICGGEGRGENEPRNVRFLYARFVRRLSIRLTWVLLRLNFNANQATVLGILIGVAGALLLASTNLWLLLLALFLMQLSFVMDYSDGEIARFEGSSGPAGAYLDWIGHYYIPALASLALAWGAVKSGTGEWLFVPAVAMALSLLRIPYSARDHILLGIYRDNVVLRQDPAFVRAVLARQGGDPERIDPYDPGPEPMQGTGGEGFLWRRHTNLGQVLVFPGFVNVICLGVAIDLLLSGSLPTVDSSAGRAVLVAGLGVVHLVHQLRAAAQSVRILRLL
jgi:phosphatidylglycerophosphate synthase